MIFLYIYIGFSLLTFVLMLLQMTTLIHRFENKYKDKLTKNKNLNQDQNKMPFFFEILKMFVKCFIPILNVIFFCSVLFLGNRIETQVTRKVENEMKLKDIMKKTN